MHKTYTVEEARKKLEHYCAYQERCHEEVVQKLRAMHMIPQAIDAIVVHLITHDFLNEERFACSFARGRFRIKHWGRRRIENELRARGVSAYNIARALKEVPDNDYHDTFDALAEKQWAGLKDTDTNRKKAKVAAYLLRKGYESSMVYEKIASFQ